MKALSLFSGIGAFEKALDNLGVDYELAAYCEIDKYASRSYAAIHGVSESLNLGDITKVDEKALPHDLDLITYGFPCQDISISGRMRGLFDENGNQTRSGLFFEALRIIEETQPRVAIAENVKNLTGTTFRKQFELVLKSLEDAGYNNYWKVLNLKDFGIPQNRERVFIVSIRKDIDNGTFRFPEGFPLTLRLKDVLEDEVDERFYMSDKAIDGLNRRKAQNAEKGNGFGWKPTSGEGVATTLSTSAGCKMTDNYIIVNSEPQVRQIGNCCPTKTRDNPNQGRIYDAEGIAPALNCMGGGNRQPCVLDEGKAFAAAMRGRYNDDGKTEQQFEVSDRECANTITSVQKDSLAAVTEPAVLTPKRTEYGKAIHKAYEAGEVWESRHNMTTLEPRTDGISNTLTTVQKDNYVMEPTMRIRKLTPKECFRLMGFADTDYEKAAAVNSNTQLYKQAGNSIGVPVVQYLIQALIDCGALQKQLSALNSYDSALQSVARIDAAPTLSLNTLRDEIYQDAVAHGLFEDFDKITDPVRKRRALAMRIMEEAAEMYAAAEDPEHYAEEAADVTIMTGDVCGYLDMDWQCAVMNKMAVNKERPWKHGRE